METLVIKVDSKQNATKLLEAIALFKGVKNVAKANLDELENISILEACKVARKTKKVPESEIFNALK